MVKVEDILLTNTTSLSLLGERQSSCWLYIDNIGDILDHLTNITSSYKARLHACMLFDSRAQKQTTEQCSA
jgi:hypothetical protein